MGNADIFGLAAINQIAENPTAGGTMGVLAYSAKVAVPAGGHTRYRASVANLYTGYAGADFHYLTAEFVTDNGTGLDSRQAAALDVNVCSADCGCCDPDDRIIAFDYLWYRYIIKADIAWAVVNYRFHCFLIHINPPQLIF
jgi:hypothetical protein